MSARNPLALAGFALVVAIALLSFFLFRSSGPALEPRPAEAVPVAPESVRARSELASAPAEPARAAVDAPSVAPEDEASALAPHASQATLAIRVVARESGAPLAAVRVRFFRGAKPEVAATRVGRGATSGTKLLTDADGFVDCLVPAGERLTVRTGDEPWIHRPESVEIDTPAAGGRAELVIDVATAWTVSFFGRVRTVEGAPIADARIVIDSGSRRYADGRLADELRRLVATRSEPDGLFELRLPEWDAYVACIDAPGFSLVMVTVDGAHASPASAFDVTLRRAATLAVRVLDERGGRLGIAVVLETRGKSLLAEGSKPASPRSLTTFFWNARTDARGEAILEGLPARVQLSLRLQERDRNLHVANGTLVLEPGERREIELPAYRGRTLRGRVVEGERPVPGQKVCRLAPHGERVRHLASFDRTEQEVESDGEGRFAFEEVPFGTWWISLPAPQGNDARAPVSLPVEVVVVPGLDPPEIVVAVERDATIRGRVVDAAGDPAGQILVVASRREPTLMRVAHSDAEGHFEVGPLPVGTFELGAIDASKTHAPSERLDVAAGAVDVVLRLRAACSLSGRVVDAATRAPCDAEVDLIVANAQGYGVRPTQASEGRFEDSGMLPGTYAACASTTDGRFGYVAGIVLVAGSAASEVELAVAPGARLSLATKSVDPVSFEAWHEGACVACGSVTALRPEQLILPAGRVTLRTRAGGVASERELELAVGASSVLEIGP